MKVQSPTAVALCVFVLLFGKPTIAQPQPAPTAPVSPQLSTPEQQELEQLRQEKRLEALIEEEINNNAAVRDQVQQEVDRAIGANTTLLNILLSLLTLLPVLIAVGFLLIRRSVINEIVAETRKQLQQEVNRQLEEEVAQELKEQTQSFRDQIEALKTEFIDQLSQLQTLFLDAQEEKKKIFQEISAITASSIQKESVAPEVQRKIQELTSQLDSLKAASFRLFFTVDDYVREGDAFYYEGRYEDAIVSYDEALKVEPTIFAAWRGKARTLRRLKQYEEALVCNSQAMQIKPDDGLNWFERGYILQNLQKYEAALEAYNQAIELKPTYHRAWNHRGYVRLKLDQYEQAFADLETGRELKPDYGNPYYGKALYYVLKGQMDEAFEQLRQAIHFYPRYREILANDPDFDAIRADDCFQQLLESV
jgi:tetratricopeptide (TPR) repeat protein